MGGRGHQASFGKGINTGGHDNYRDVIAPEKGKQLTIHRPRGGKGRLKYVGWSGAPQYANQPVPWTGDGGNDLVKGQQGLARGERCGGVPLER